MIFILPNKHLFVLEISKFLSWLFGLIVRTPSFFKGAEWILIVSQLEESEKLKKGGASMMQGQVFSKGGAGTCPT